MWDKLRRFGLEYCDLPTTLENVADLLRLLALNIDGREQGVPILIVIMTLIAVSSYLYVFVVSTVWFVFLRGTDSMLDRIIVFSSSIASSISLVKLFGLHLSSDLVKKSLVEYLSRDRLVDRDSRMYRSLLTHMRVVKRRAMTVWLIVMFNGMAYVMNPLRPGRHLMEDAQVLYGLEPMLETPNYEISNALMGLSAMLAVYSAGSIGALMIIVAGYIESQLRALSNEMLHLWDDAQTIVFEEHDFQKNKEIKLKNQYIKRQLVSIAQAHAANISLLRLIEKIFGSPIAIEFGLLATGMIAELLGGLENTYIAVPFTILQICMDCFIGQRIVDASLTFREAVYDCQWENFDTSNQKMVLMILQNSNTLVIKAGGIAQLGYASLMSVFKSIFSAYTALRSTMNLEAH